MCGRFVQAQPPSAYAEFFKVDVVKADPLPPSYNVAPTDRIYAVAEFDDERLLGTFRWGLLPWWAKDRHIAARNINARAETLAEKPAFRESFERRRCLIPADGFYEWEVKERGKLPHYIYATDCMPLAFAGLWSSWKDPESGDRVRTCTIVTGLPSKLVQPIHDRMPVTLPAAAWDDWLAPVNRDTEDLHRLVTASSSPPMSEHAVSTLVNSVKNNVPELVSPLETGAIG